MGCWSATRRAEGVAAVCRHGALSCCVLLLTDFLTYLPKHISRLITYLLYHSALPFNEICCGP